MMKDNVVHAIIDAAKANGIEPAALLALVEVETSGVPFENDGRTPQFLYERHIAWREATKISTRVLSAFRVAGLAIPKWNRATQYKDQRTSAQRLQLIRRARAIHEECSDRSASWGLGQTMGFLAEELGFGTAVRMVDHMTGSIDAQIECMIAELKHTHLVEPLNSHDWRHVARTYNGPGYEANQYNTRLEDAHKRWCRRLVSIIDSDGNPRPVPPEQSLPTDEVEALQIELRDLGYHEVGEPDGKWGTKTTGAIAAFQAHEGLPVTGHYDDLTKSALADANARPVGKERADTTADDLRDAGSRTIAHADSASLVGKVKLALGIGGGGAAVGQSTGVLDQVQDVASKAGSLHSTINEVMTSFGGVIKWGLNHWWVIAIVAGVVTIVLAKRIRQARVEDHRSGVHAGPSED